MAVNCEFDWPLEDVRKVPWEQLVLRAVGKPLWAFAQHLESDDVPSP